MAPISLRWVDRPHSLRRKREVLELVQWAPISNYLRDQYLGLACGAKAKRRNVSLIKLGPRGRLGRARRPRLRCGVADGNLGAQPRRYCDCQSEQWPD